MAYWYSDTPSSMSFNPQIDVSSLGSFGEAAAANSPLNNVGVDVAAAGSAPNQGLSNLMSGFTNLFSKESMLGGVNAQTGQQSLGWVMPAVSVLSGLMSVKQGRENQKLAKQQLAEQKRQFDLNYGAQRQSINTELEDRQRARVASSGGSGSYESVDSYMNRNRIR